MADTASTDKAPLVRDSAGPMYQLSVSPGRHHEMVEMFRGGGEQRARRWDVYVQ